MSQPARRRSSPSTGVRVVVLVGIWLGAVLLAAPRLGLYYETLAAWCVVPPLGLIYAYCLSHPSRATALMAGAATVLAVVVVAAAIVIPKATAV